MKRRDFLVGAAVLPAVVAIPATTQAPANKFPLIGGRYIRFIFRKDIYERHIATSPYQLSDERIVSVTDLKGGSPTTPRVEVIIRKRPGVDSVFMNAPRSYGYGADTIVDLETYTIKKSRNAIHAPLIPVPEGADVALVEANRARLL